MDSELELFQALKGLHAVAAVPELYPVFVKTRCVPSLVSLLTHENADISMDVLDLLQEMTGADDAAPDDLTVLVDALLERHPSLVRASEFVAFAKVAHLQLLCVYPEACARDRGAIPLAECHDRIDVGDEACRR